MTDNEIIKALECCANYGLFKCLKCPKRGTSKTCMYDLSKEAVDLIHRQQAEIETLKAHEEREHQLCKNACAPKYEAEIERLKNKVEELSEVLACTVRIRYAECRAEAIKEFAERLKANKFKHRNFGELVFVEDIDNLVAEMVGDSNAE